MPTLADTHYSREESISAIRDFYRLLTQLYLPESEIMEPPADGWPSITQENLRGFNKSDEVIELLRNLPYIREDSTGDQPDGAPECKFLNWQSFADIRNEPDGEIFRLLSQGAELVDSVPPHVVGLVGGAPGHPLVLLDTELGVKCHVCSSASTPPGIQLIRSAPVNQQIDWR